MGDNLDCYNQPHYYNATTRKDNHINYSEVFAICKYQPCPNRLKTRAKKAEGNRFVPTPKDPVTTGSGETFVKTRSPVTPLGLGLQIPLASKGKERARTPPPETPEPESSDDETVLATVPTSNRESSPSSVSSLSSTLSTTSSQSTSTKAALAPTQPITAQRGTPTLGGFTPMTRPIGGGSRGLSHLSTMVPGENRPLRHTGGPPTTTTTPTRRITHLGPLWQSVSPALPIVWVPQPRSHP